MVGVLRAASLAQHAGLRHGFFTREGGVSEGLYASLNGGVGSRDKPENVAENRARMAAELGVARDRLVTAYQIHSAEVVVAERAWTPDTRPRADAIVTQIPNLAVGVSTADCGPVLFADPRARVVGAAHAGWRGALTGILEATLVAMEGLGAKRRHIAAALGPMIRRPNYEVGSEFVARFTAADPNNRRFFAATERPDHAMFDLPGYIRARLTDAGLEQMEDLAACTYAEPARFFSYRRTTHRGEPDYGRHVNAIALVDAL
jgi:polyphenol oxidase